MKRMVEIVLLMVAMFASAPSQDNANESNRPSGDGQSQLDKNKALIRRLFEEWINQKNLSSVDEIVSPDYVDHALPPDAPRGPESTKKFLAPLLAAFPDVHVTIQDMIAEGDKVVVRNTWHATHKGMWNGVAATGRQVTFSGIVIWRIANGKLTDRWANIDELGMMRQLGAITVSPKQ